MTHAPPRTLIVTGMSGAGKTTALHTLEDLGWEVVDNLPIPLLKRLLGATPDDARDEARPLAIGIDSRTRGFDAVDIIRRIERLAATHDISTLFLDCSAAELERRFAETRRRHPLALDRAASDGIAQEQALLAPLRAWSENLIDTSGLTSRGLQGAVRDRFAGAGAATTLVVMSFGYARGLPRNADLVFDMRFLRNPHWDDALRPLTGRDAPVADYVRADPAYAEAVDRIEGLLRLLIPRYQAEGKAYVVMAFGCTGGRHRSVHVTETVAARLRAAGFSPTIVHRDLPEAPDALPDRR
ncbi:UPF0042 nucleotide-binding protein [Sphingomonas jejuensis]|uniref:UPF0042 nucleotide-binding protein n=1 Tax=Sphingomonas jejuensis TaxID=904715 RepID=A0ABX0XKQ9_9SPHN|nr:RNase adapter RapZ [Sphingomonas jejuensis]NJC33321.1 UPF0042 nucleotide-binding protein [Sphingomonas jejuensis]